MITLIEIFDSKQYENIISSVMLADISKIIYIGSKEVMTKSKTDSLSQFFRNRKFNTVIEFLFVQRDNSASIQKLLKAVVERNNNCVFDATGGEDVILTNVGIIAQQFSIPIIRINPQSCKIITINGDKVFTVSPGFKFTAADFVTLHGGEILNFDTVTRFNSTEIEDIHSIFAINSADCEAYSAFCNIFPESISADKKTATIDTDKYNYKISKIRPDVDSIRQMFIDKGLFTLAGSQSNKITYRLKSPAVAQCLCKSGNVLEYYTALGLSACSDRFRDILVGVNMDWNLGSSPYDTKNEVDVMAVYNNFPVFISCKNGEVKKDALYELDTVARRLGGTYAKKILVCTHISRNRSARSHFIKRARDMGIYLIFDVHKKTEEEFIQYLLKIAR